jgi:aminoglycoside 6'-N-acetyltransferase
MAPDRVLRGERLLLRPAEEADAAAILEVLHEPAVAAWWGENDLGDVLEELAISYVIEVGGAVAGWLLVHEEDEPDYRHVAFDIALTTDLQGGGLGPEALRLAIRDCIARGHHRFTIDPTVGNERAIRAYASVGFRPVGVLRAYERDPVTGGWRDGLLMDLLADEVT